jgi:hypothetical protein
VPTKRMLFVRVGWMHYYHGVMPDDIGPVGGGSYNKENIGSEVVNFKPFQGHVYGYFEPLGKTSLERIESGTGLQETLDNVLVIFVAKRPRGGQVIVGWYRNATVMRNSRKSPPQLGGKGRVHNVVAKATNAFLLPSSRRIQQVPVGAGGMGQANMCYPLREDGGSKVGPWMRAGVRFVGVYNGPNLMLDHSLDEVDDAAKRLESVVGASTGQGFATNPADRRALEQLAMKRARAYFHRHFTNVEVVSAIRPYDLHCAEGKKELLVEVKGTTGNGSVVILTRNEFALAKKGKSALYILHSVKLKKGHASGGKERVLRSWDVKDGVAIPIAYTYKLT